MNCNWDSRKDEKVMLTHLHRRPDMGKNLRLAFQSIASTPEELDNYLHDFVQFDGSDYIAELTYINNTPEIYQILETLSKYELQDFGIYLAQYWYQIVVDDTPIIVVHDIIHSTKKSYIMRIFHPVKIQE